MEVTLTHYSTRCVEVSYFDPYGNNRLNKQRSEKFLIGYDKTHFSLRVIRSVEESGVSLSRSSVHTADFDLLGNRYTFFHDLFLNLKKNNIKKSSHWSWLFNIFAWWKKNSQLCVPNIFNKHRIWRQCSLVENLPAQIIICCYCLLKTEHIWAIDV